MPDDNRLPHSEERANAIRDLRFYAIGLSNAQDAWLEKARDYEKAQALAENKVLVSYANPTPSDLDIAASQEQTQFNIRNDYARKAVNAARQFIDAFADDDGRLDNEFTRPRATPEIARLSILQRAAADAERARHRQREADNALARAIDAYKGDGNG